MWRITDSGYETDSPKFQDSVVCDVHDVSSDEDEEEEKFHVDSFLTFPKKLVGSQNIHSTMINSAMINALIDTGSQVSILSATMY